MEPLRKIVTGEDETPDSKPWLHNALSLLAVYVIGFAGWFLSYKAGAWDSNEPEVPESPEQTENILEIVGLALGYISAVCYLWYDLSSGDLRLVEANDTQCTSSSDS